MVTAQIRDDLENPKVVILINLESDESETIAFKCHHLSTFYVIKTILTAGNAKNDIPKIAKQLAINLPAHVCGVLSPYPMVVRVI